jgi:hypothetical protein
MMRSLKYLLALLIVLLAILLDVASLSSRQSAEYAGVRSVPGKIA